MNTDYDEIVSKAIDMVDTAILQACKEGKYTLLFEACPYTKHALRGITGLNFTYKVKGASGRRNRLEVSLITKDGKSNQVLLRARLNNDGTVNKMTGSFENVYKEYAQYMLNKDKTRKEIRNGSGISLSEEVFTNTNSMTLEEPVQNSVEAYIPNTSYDVDSENIKDEQISSHEHTPQTEPLSPENEEQESHENPSRLEPIVERCINEVSDTYSVSIKIESCPYTEVFYPWIKNIVFEKGESGVKITATGEHKENWTAEDASAYIRQYNENCKKRLYEVLDTPGDTFYHKAKAIVVSTVCEVLSQGKTKVIDLRDGTRISFIAVKEILDGHHNFSNRKYNHEMDTTGKVHKTHTYSLVVNIWYPEKNEWESVYQEFWNSATSKFRTVDSDELSKFYKTIAQCLEKEYRHTNNSPTKDNEKERELC